jgi:hypothetical protein
MTAAAFRATYSDWRVIKGRKVVQVVFEVPIETADIAYKVVGGMPHPGNEAWFGIAKLDPSQQREEPSAPSKAQIPAAQPRQSHPAGAPQTYAKRLGMACTQPRFWMFMFEHTKRQFSVTNEEEAANVVRNYLGCKRRDTIVNTPAGNKARDLLADFDVWTRGILA